MSELFFSERLEARLSLLRRSALTVVEAPAGYGKTTALHRALQGVDRDSQRWYTAAAGERDGSFLWFLRHIETVDPDAAARIRAFGPLNRSNAAAIADILAGLAPEKPLYIVIDNFQLVAGEWQPQLLRGLASMKPGGLRLILAGQSFGRLRPTVEALGSGLCYIGVRELALSRDDMGRFAEMLGLEPDAAQIDRAWSQTRGWTAVVALYLENLMVRGRAQFTASDVDGLLNRLFWSGLPQHRRVILLRLCLLDRVNLRDAWHLLDGSREDFEELREIPGRIPLIGYDRERMAYYPHEILRGFLRRRLEGTEESFRRKVYSRTGRHYMDLGTTREAIAWFFRAEDWEGILCCRLTGLMSEHFDGEDYPGVARAVLEHSPDSLLAKYPLSLLRLCLALYGGADFRRFEEQSLRARGIIAALGDSQLMGEWTLLSALSYFPDLSRMTLRYRRAEELMSAPSALFTKEEPFMFGSTSMWYLFYTRPGEMMATAEAFAKTMNIYNRLTEGHGAGAAELYLGEALSVQGRFEESEIQGLQAAILAERSGNAPVVYGSCLLLGINAVYQGDMLALQKAVEKLEAGAHSFPWLEGSAVNTCMVETVRGYLLGLMMEPGCAAPWIQGEADGLSDLGFTNFMVKTCRITDLILKKEYRRAIASVEASLKMDPRLISLPTRNFMYVGLTLCYLAIAQPGRAAEYLEKSLRLAEQDHNYTFLACFRKYFSALFLLQSVSQGHECAIRDIKALKLNYTRAEESRIFAMLEDAPERTEELTDREREIAELVAQGLRNSEIARTLHVSENTVKSHLKSIFKKLNIDRRSGLVELLR